jgi:hypothetical protein
MPEAAFVMSTHQHHPLRELAESARHELELQAVPSSLHVGGFPEPRPDRVYVLLDPRSYVAAEGAEALPDDAILARTVLLCVEPPPTDPSDPHLALLRRAGAVFAIDQRAVVTLSRLGIRARLLRPGYTRIHDYFDPAADRPIDVLFLGAHTLRRTRYLNRAAHVLARLNCAVYLAGPEQSSLPADAKWPLLAQTKVVVNFHGGEQSRLEWRRVVDAIHAGAVVVTEHSSGIAPLVAGEHLLVASADSLPFVAESLVNDPERLATMRIAAYERLSAWIPFALPVAVLRAAIVERVGEPMPAEVSLGSPRPAAAPEPSLSATIGAHARPAPDDLDSVPVEVDVLEETPAWASARPPRVSVLTTLPVAGQHGLAETLDSVAQSAVRDVELVIVAAGTDQDGTAPSTWMQAHPGMAVRLVRAGADASVGRARNAALAVARAPLCLPLDTGQELYPRCLGVLVEALDADRDADFAYPILEVIGAPDRFADVGGDYLLSFLGWDAQRLRRGNYIHAPALIRTEVLRAAGGFAEDDRLRGFEDYDLWCRIADRGGRGRLVPQVLARRAESEHWAVLETVRPTPGAHTSALAERAPGLLAGAFTSPQ